MRTNHFFIENSTIYQVFGHKPVGYAATVDLFKYKDNPNSKTYHITLDTSNSFAGTNTHNILDGMSFNCFYINDKTFKVYSKINAKFSNGQHDLFAENHKSINTNIKEGSPYIIYSSVSDKLTTSGTDLTLKDLIIDYDLDSYTEIFSTMTEKKLSDNQINFHGAITTNGIKYFIFTYNKPKTFDKTLYYINFTDLEKLVYSSTQIGGSSNASEIEYLKIKVSALKHKLKKYKLKYSETKTKSKRN
jgi:hypothetical protein